MNKIQFTLMLLCTLFIGTSIAQSQSASEKITELRFSTQEREITKCIFPEILHEYNQAQRQGLDIKDALSRPSLPLHYDTDNFRIHYSLTGTDGCTAEFAARVGEVFENVWEYEIETMGFLPPPSDDGEGGNNKYDIYIRNLAYYYGSTMPEYNGPESWDDATSYIEIEDDFDGFPATYDPEGSPWGQLKVTAAHEFFHAVQLAYNGSTDEIWAMEASAVWIEEQVYPVVDDYLSFIDDYYSSPHIGLTIGTMHAYASAPFCHYVSNLYSYDAIKDVLEYSRYSDEYVDCFKDMFDDNYTDFATSFGDFTVWNWYTGSRTKAEYYGSEGGLWPEVYVERTVNSYPASFSITNRPNYLACNYIKMQNIAPTADNLRIVLYGSSTTDWETRTIVVRTDDSEEIINNGTIEDGNMVTYILNAESIEMVIFIPSAVRGGVDQSYVTYSYSIEAEFTNEATISEKSVPTVLSTKVYPNPFNSTCTIELDKAFEQNAILQLFSMDGRMVQSQNIDSGNKDVILHTANLPSDVYLYKILSNKQSINGKISLNK